jgi:hypothetical protein
MMALSPSVALAQEGDAQKDANAHFQRAVALYAEADYHGALVEFKRAYEIAPHVTVLYNLGQTYYQMQNYADALATFERFLAEGGTSHRSEVESAVGVLKSRVGKVEITTSTPGWEIAVDDEIVGKTPLAKSVGVSVGRRKITATKAGETTLTRTVEVAAGDTQTVSLVAAAGPAPSPTAPSDAPAPAPDKGSRSTLLTVGWIGTGVLAAGAIVTGIIATGAASDLKEARDAFPGDKSDIDSKASKTTAFALTTDVLGVAAIVLGGISLYFTLTSPSKTGQTKPPAPGVRMGGPGNLILGGTF